MSIPCSCNNNHSIRSILNIDSVGKRFFCAFIRKRRGFSKYSFEHIGGEIKFKKYHAINSGSLFHANGLNGII